MLRLRPAFLLATPQMAPLRFAPLRPPFPSVPAQRILPQQTARMSLFAGSQRAFGNLFNRAPPKTAPEAGKAKGGLAHQHHIRERTEADEEKEEQAERESAWFKLPFGAPFHTVNIVMVLILTNILSYLAMWYCGDDWRDFFVEHFTLSHANAHRIYPFLTCAFYQEHLLQLAIDVWLLAQFGRTMLGFLGGVRMGVFWAMCSVGGGLLHVGRQWVELNVYGMDPVDVRGRCYGPNPFILGLVGVEGLIFRHLNFMQNPPIPFLVLTAFVMIIDVWRIFTTKPQEHGAATGGALVAYLFWRLPTKSMGLDKLTATM